jgi:hypothetical protein
MVCPPSVPISPQPEHRDVVRGFPQPVWIAQRKLQQCSSRVAVGMGWAKQLDLQWPVHPAEQPSDANCNYGGRIGLRLDGAT